MNLPNVLTLSRIVLAGVVLVLMAMPLPFAKSLTLVLFILASITDYFDGQLARSRYGVTSFGKLMDPLADKILTCVVFVGFVEIRLPFYPDAPLLPAWMVVVIISREYMVTGLRLLAAGKGKLISAGRWGKHKTVWQIVVICVVLLGLAVRFDILRHAGIELLKNYDFAFHWIALALGSAASLITVASGYMYIHENFDLIRRNI